MKRVLGNSWPVWHYPFTAALSTLRQDHNFHPLNQRRINLEDIQIRRASRPSQWLMHPPHPLVFLFLKIPNKCFKTLHCASRSFSDLLSIWWTFLQMISSNKSSLRYFARSSRKAFHIFTQPDTQWSILDWIVKLNVYHEAIPAAHIWKHSSRKGCLGPGAESEISCKSFGLEEKWRPRQTERNKKVGSSKYKCFVWRNPNHGVGQIRANKKYRRVSSRVSASFCAAAQFNNLVIENIFQRFQLAF